MQNFEQDEIIIVKAVLAELSKGSLRCNDKNLSHKLEISTEKLHFVINKMIANLSSPHDYVNVLQTFGSKRYIIQKGTIYSLLDFDKWLEDNQPFAGLKKELISNDNESPIAIPKNTPTNQVPFIERFTPNQLAIASIVVGIIMTIIGFMFFSN